MTGHLRRYVDKRLSDESLRRIAVASQIADEYESKGLTMSLRQLYYQHVTRGLIENNDREYNRLKGLVSDGRLAGLISWTAIEDRGRNLMGLTTWDTPEARLRDARDDFRRNKWQDQRVYPEVWVEKQALEGVVATICNRLEVDFFSCKGYNSQSEQWRAGRRFAGRVQRGQTPIVFHLGDHDPSGIDMTRDNRERLEMFAGVPVQVTRLALNIGQVRAHDLPPNPTKFSDSRAEAYVAEYGHSSWELDALSPLVIQNLIEDAVNRVRDPGLWEESLERENAERLQITDIIEGGGMGGNHGAKEDED